METIDKLDKIGWIVYVGSVTGMLFLVVILALSGWLWKRVDIVKTGSIIAFWRVLMFTQTLTFVSGGIRKNSTGHTASTCQDIGVITLGSGGTLTGITGSRAAPWFVIALNISTPGGIRKNSTGNRGPQDFWWIIAKNISTPGGIRNPFPGRQMLYTLLKTSMKNLKHGGMRKNFPGVQSLAMWVLRRCLWNTALLIFRSGIAQVVFNWLTDYASCSGYTV